MPENTPDAASARTRLAEIIKERCLTFGEFRLASGRTSNYFIDGKQATSAAQCRYPHLGRRTGRAVRRWQTDPHSLQARSDLMDDRQLYGGGYVVAIHRPL